MKPFATSILCCVIVLITITGYSQKLGINTNTPQHNVDIHTPVGLQLTGNDAVLNAKYSGTNVSNTVAVKGESIPQNGCGVGGKFSGGWWGAMVEGQLRGLRVDCSPYENGFFGGTGIWSYYESGMNATSYGVKSEVFGNNSQANYAIYGKAAFPSEINIGIYGMARDGATNWAGYFDDGNVYIKNSLGIGQLNPTVDLDILSPQAVAKLTSSNAVNGSVLSLQNSTAAPTFLGAINFGDGNSAPGQIGYLADHNFTIRVNNSEKLRINSSGLVGIGRTPSTNKLEVEGSASKSSSGDWLANSDARLKKNIQALDEKDMIEKLLTLKGVTYEWNDDKTGTERPDGIQYGFTAQNIQEVFPTLVEEDAKGYLQTAYGTYDAMMIEALRYLYTENQSLKKDLVNQSRKNDLEMQSLKSELEEIRNLIQKAKS